LPFTPVAETSPAEGKAGIADLQALGRIRCLDGEAARQRLAEGIELQAGAGDFDAASRINDDTHLAAERPGVA
jgi:hypothetical protein